MSLLVVLLLAAAAWQMPAPQPPPETPLQPTVHAQLPQNVEDYWLAPRPSDVSAARNPALAEAAWAYASGNYSSALSSARGQAAGGRSRFTRTTTLRVAPALSNRRGQTARSTRFEKKPDGSCLSRPCRQAKPPRAAATSGPRHYDGLGSLPDAPKRSPRLATASLAAGNRSRAAEPGPRHYEFPALDGVDDGPALESLQDLIEKKDTVDLGRADLSARNVKPRRDPHADIQKRLNGDDREVADLRIAESDYFLKRYAAARDGVQPYLEQASRKAEAKFFYLSALRGLGEYEQALSLTRALVAEFPDSSWASEALNNLGTHYIVTNQDDQAAQTFKELFDKLSNGPHAERAAWKYGWWAYTTGNYAETARVFGARRDVSRSDYRPQWLYWSARARENWAAQSAEARMAGSTGLFELRTRPLEAKRLPVEAVNTVASARARRPERAPTGVRPNPRRATVRDAHSHLLAAGCTTTPGRG